MANQQDATQDFIIDVEQGPGIDFSGYYSYPEVGSPLSLFPNYETIQATNMLRSHRVYLQSQTGNIQIGTGPFVLRFSINATELQHTSTATQSGGMMMLLLANSQNTVSQYTANLNQEGLAYSFRNYNNGTTDVYLMRITLWNSTGVYIGELGGGVTFLNTTYDVEIGRDSSNYPYMSIYNHSDTIPYDPSLFIATRHPQDAGSVWQQDSNDIRYLVPLCSAELIGDYIATGNTTNYHFL